MESFFQSAQACYQKGDLDGAKACCQLLLSHQPGNARGLHLLGVVHLQQRESACAIEYIKSALELSSRQAAWICDLGNAYLQQGDLSSAISSYRAALEIDPKHLLSMHNLGEALFQNGDVASSMRCFESVIGSDPTYPYAHYNLGNLFKSQCRYREASDAYHRSLELAPLLLEAHYNLANTLKEMGSKEDALGSYQEVLKLNSRYLPALVNIGCALTELGRIDEAIAYLERASAIDPANAHIRLNLDHAYGRVIPAWHFPMLADQERNNAYQRAIERAVKSGMHVLDIGAGSGLLAMMAARAGAARVTACEMVPAIAKTAREIIERNGYAERVTLLEKKSTRIELAEDMRRRADLIISEIVDVGLLGEGVIPTLRHACRHLAVAGARLIPQGATLYGKLVSLPRMRPAHPIREISGFDLSLFDRFRGGDIYQQIDLNAEPHRCLTDRFTVTTIDFRNLPQPVPDEKPEVKTLKVAASQAGTIHAVAFWFELYLDEATKLSTAPDGNAFNWKQAVQFFRQDRVVGAGERLALEVAISDTRILFKM